MDNVVPPHTQTGKRKFLVIGLFLVIVLASISFAVAQNSRSGKNAESEHVIELREDGFYPSELHISKGDPVRFITKLNQSFWPASDPHPTHTIYSGFDSERPIETGQSWTFIFNNEGTFKYHDHLVPAVTGTLIVGTDSNFSSVTDKQTCMQLTTENQQKTCWRFLLENTLKKNGLKKSFVLFRELAQLLPNECHQFAHDLGEYAFQAHARGENVQLDEAASFCGYGFWHGFMAKMMKESDFEAAKKFCESMASSTPELTSTARDNCAHGIGIGLIPDPPPPELWGNAQPLIESALRYCSTIEKKDFMIDNCYSGVFHAIIDYMQKKQYGFHFDPTSPLALCLAQEEQYGVQCYYQVAAKLPSLTNRNLANVFQLLQQISDVHVFQHTFALAIMNFINQQMSNEDYLNFLEDCQKLDSTVSNLCITGVIRSLFATGTPEKEYLKGIEFCSSKRLHDQDQLQCFEDVVKLSRLNYAEDKVRDICGTIEKTYHAICK